MQLPSSRYGYLLDTTQVEFLSRLYSMLYDVTVDCTDLPHTCWKYTSATIKGKTLGSINTRSASSSNIIAIWNRKFFGHPSVSIVEDFTVANDNVLRAARINYFLLHRPTIDKEDRTVLLISLSWYKFHHKMLALGKPLTVWCPDIFEPESMHSQYYSMAVQMFDSRVITLLTKINDKTISYCMSLC